MQPYEDLNDDRTTGVGIMTNAPTFDYHLINIKHLQRVDRRRRGVVWAGGA
jgi:penicillin V acylase-like amidase (Ntn superfamily)